jgi:Lar family restriction alleviation protein
VSEEVKLEPCPFCGSTPILEEPEDRYEYWVISCNPKSDCSFDPSASFRTKESAIKHWNSRAPTKADLQQAIDAGILEAATNAAYERGKAEGAEAERERIVERLTAKRKWDTALSENAYELGAPATNVASFRVAVQVWDMAIEIVNQE